ncbi:rhamnogalacturonan acetylesterase [Isoptericola halotolerans]|uniref:Lysophospholipase L1-like esterase n=1 Tax=Isoptericola halotolerans TaxID=300560 RepID=A0ABX2A5B1_9MICO|nr:rhamnogalacturonan acetylesterase [Isoptericola halotolerans]NOV97113.1 lysophospholipase L1-like esterase [Isoptericola halotolerans]
MTIHLAGDSTVAPTDHGATSGHPEIPLLGWGDELAPLVDDEVHNTAVGGATTRSFREEGHWARVTDALRPGDTVVIQFGHNDQKHPGELAADGGYRRRLDEFVTEVRDAGARPVLATSVERRWFEADGSLRWSHGAYPAAVRSLAAERHVPLIDLTIFTRWLYAWLGATASAALFPHGAAAEAGLPVSTDLTNDNTHYTTAGARYVARYVAEALVAIDGVHDATVPMGVEIMAAQQG